MALISKFGIDDVYKQLKDRFRAIRSQSVALNSAASAGNMSFSVLAEYMRFLSSTITTCDERIARYSGAALEAYARDQEESASYDPATEYAAMKSAAQAVISTLTTALPANSSHTVSNGVVVEPTFTPAQTASLRTQLTALVATIGAP